MAAALIHYLRSTMAIDAKGWKPLGEARPEWLDPIELYGT
jgi:hypothetical protein